MKRCHAAMTGASTALLRARQAVRKSFRRPDGRPSPGAPWRILTAASVVPVLVDSWYSAPLLNGNQMTLLLLAAFAAASVLTIWRPVSSAIMMTTLYAASCLLPSTVSSLIIAPLALNVVMLARIRTVMGFAAAFANAGATLAKALSVSGDVTYGYGTAATTAPSPSGISAVAGSGGLYWESTMGTCAILLMCAFAGAAWAYRTDAAASEREREALHRRLTNIDLADQLHNSLCNDLVYIVYAASHALDTAHGTDDAAYDLGQITQTARSALDKTRTVIAALEHADAVEGPEGGHMEQQRHGHHPTRKPNRGPTAPMDLDMLVDEYDRRLHRLGFAGGTIATVTPDWAADHHTSRIVHDTVAEIYTNILKYAEPQGGYVVAIRAAGGALVVSAANTIRPDPDPQLVQGTGMRRCAAAVESLGGSLVTQQDAGHWTCTMTVPLHQDEGGSASSEPRRHWR